MQKNSSAYIVHQTGDKVRISVGELKGQRGTIQTVSSEGVEVHLKTGAITTFPPEQITNFSLAARKAWQTMRQLHQSSM